MWAQLSTVYKCEPLNYVKPLNRELSAQKRRNSREIIVWTKNIWCISRIKTPVVRYLRSNVDEA